MFRPTHLSGHKSNQTVELFRIQKRTCVNFMFYANNHNKSDLTFQCIHYQSHTKYLIFRTTPEFSLGFILQHCDEVTSIKFKCKYTRG
jgi:hypothetical protein